MRFIAKSGFGAVLLMVCTLAACGDNSGQRGDPADERTAAGEVRGGTISDDMLPLDSLKSQSPPLRQSTQASAGDADSRNSDEGASEADSGDSNSQAEGAASETAED